VARAAKEALKPAPGTMDRRLREAAILLLLPFVAYLFLALWTYSPGDPGWSHAGDSGAVKNIAKRSGGRATELKGADDLSIALAAVADELHQQYLLGFTPAAFDGQVHKIEVRVQKPGFTVRARETYVAVR